MTEVLSALSIAIAASGVWLTLRMVNRRKRFIRWIVVAGIVVVPFLYIVSFGPACWLADTYQRYEDVESLRRLYWPLRNSLFYAPRPIQEAVFWWGGLGIRYTSWDFIILCCGSDTDLDPPPD